MNILSVAVDPKFQRNQIGTSIVEKLKDKLIIQKRIALNCVVAESNLRAQLFFKKNKFSCIGIARKPYENSDEDGYIMSFSNDNDDKLESGNRISSFIE